MGLQRPQPGSRGALVVEWTPRVDTGERRRVCYPTDTWGRKRSQQRGGRRNPEQVAWVSSRPPKFT